MKNRIISFEAAFVKNSPIYMKFDMIFIGKHKESIGVNSEWKRLVRRNISESRHHRENLWDETDASFYNKFSQSWSDYE